MGKQAGIGWVFEQRERLFTSIHNPARDGSALASCTLKTRVHHDPIAIVSSLRLPILSCGRLHCVVNFPDRASPTYMFGLHRVFSRNMGVPSLPLVPMPLSTSNHSAIACRRAD